MITSLKLKEILEQHLIWLNDRAKGEQANLNSADLSGAYLSRADLNGAYLRSANLNHANLSCANLSDADLSGARLPNFKITPEEGAFVGWKKLDGYYIAKLLIPNNAKRVSSLVGRKCRASHVEVLDIIDISIESKHGSIEHDVCGIYDLALIYRVGQTVKADSFNDDIRVECTHGIHFFITRKEAEEYNG